MKLSNNLDLVEVTRSESAKRFGIKNDPNPEQLESLKKLAEKVFQPVRDHFGKPIRISSGFRSEGLNKKIKGSATSQHCKGEAIDIDMDGTDITNASIFEYIKNNIEFDQLIWEFGTDKNPDWVHVSYKEGANRKSILKAYKDNGRTKYKPM